MIEKATHVKGGALMLRRIGVALLAVVLCVGLAPTLSWADESDSDDENASVAAVDENAEESAQEVADSETEAAEDENSEGAETTDAASENVYDEEAAATLLENLTKRFSVGGADSSITNDTVYAAIALNMLGLGSQIDKDAILANLDSYEETSGNSLSAGVLAKYIFALTAAGVNCEAATVGGITRNLVSEMDDLVSLDTIDIYSAVWVLGAYSYGSYEQGECEMSIEALADFIIGSRNDVGMFGSSEYGYDTQTTAQAMFALALYQDDVIADSLNYILDDPDMYESLMEYAGDILGIIFVAEAAIIDLQNNDGGFGYSVEYPGSNIDATANASAALMAMGYDPTDPALFYLIEGDSTPMGYLIAEADENLDGYTLASTDNEPMTSATVLMALAAVESNLNFADLKALSVDDGTTSTTGGTGSGTRSGFTFPTASTGSSGTSGTSGLTSSSTSRTIAQTGDETIIAATVVGVVAVAAIVLIIVALFRMRKLRRD